jgi:hypothetical protein
MEIHSTVALPKKEHQFLLGGKLDGPQSQKGVLNKRKIRARAGIRTPDLPASSQEYPKTVSTVGVYDCCDTDTSLY